MSRSSNSGSTNKKTLLHHFFIQNLPDPTTVDIEDRIIAHLDGEEYHDPRENDVPYIERYTADEQEAVGIILNNLPFKLRECYVLRVTEGLTYRAIAKRVGCSADTARQRVLRANKTIATIVEEWTSDNDEQ